MDRIGKPFNPLLGETYELVTPEIRCLTEAVSHHPPIFAIMSEGSNFRYYKHSESSQKFTGK